MEQSWEGIYALLLVELNKCTDAGQLETVQTECCYRVACEYWKRAEKIWKDKRIYTDEEEINFFRVIKPQFTSHIEYYLLLNQCLLFMPNDPCEATTHWKYEEKRFERFCKRHSTFISYLEGEYRHWDEEYFLQRNNRYIIPPQERIYDDQDCRSSQDWLIRAYKANRMYNEYVKKRLGILNL